MKYSCTDEHGKSVESGAIIGSIILGGFVLTWVGAIGYGIYSSLKAFKNTLATKKYLNQEANRQYYTSLDQLFQSKEFKDALHDVGKKVDILSKKDLFAYFDEKGISAKTVEYKDIGFLNTGKIMGIQIQSPETIISGVKNKSKGFGLIEIDNKAILISKTHAISPTGVEESHDSVNLYIAYKKHGKVYITCFVKAKANHDKKDK